MEYQPAVGAQLIGASPIMHFNELMRGIREARAAYKPIEYIVLIR